MAISLLHNEQKIDDDNMFISGRRVNVSNVETKERQNRIINDAEISRQLGMIKETIAPDYERRRYSTSVVNNTTDVDEILNNDMRMVAQSTELEFRRNTFWKSCCDIVIDRRATVFFTQVGVGAFVAIFAMMKILTSDPYSCSGDDPSVYIGLISMILGWFAPAPSMK